MKLNLALLFSSAFALFGSIHAIVTDDIKDCDGHPDPHFRNFHGVAFDFQSGCDVVLVKTEQIEIHTRLIQQGRYSAIIEAGARIGRTTVVIESNGTATVNGTKYSSSGSLNLGDGFNLQKISNETSPYNWKVGFPEVDGEEFSLSVAAGGGTYPRQPIDGEGEHSSYMAFNIHAHVSLFEESEGLCGSWNDDSPSPAGFVDREGDQMTLPPLYPGSFYSYNATALGENWQVDTSQGD
eukprot:scaffold2148_cov264-Chaetoceros_neogracile.AAC.27